MGQYCGESGNAVSGSSIAALGCKGPCGSRGEVRARERRETDEVSFPRATHVSMENLQTFSDLIAGILVLATTGQNAYVGPSVAPRIFWK